MKKKQQQQQRVWRHLSAAKRGSSYPSTSDGIKERNSCTNLEIVAIPMEDISLIEVMWSLYECSLPRANNMEYVMKNILNEKKL